MGLIPIAQSYLGTILLDGETPSVAVQRQNSDKRRKERETYFETNHPRTDSSLHSHDGIGRDAV